MKLNPLSPEEKRVIKDKGTETPFSGKYDDFYEDGIYVCRQCGAPLYRSEDKFDAHCGWPSFDSEVIGATKKVPDPDGSRTEISCVRCGAHLGHVFTGEHLTDNDTRYCVNSVSMEFVPRKNVETKQESVYFGSGCFWCSEAVFKMIKGVIAITPGYSGGLSANPTYEQVCSGTTEHAEVIKIDFDPNVISLEGLLQVFFTTHDPTTKNMQGNDMGTQYRSIILYTSDLQKEIIENFVKTLEADKKFPKPVVTEVSPFKKFYEAEEYHKDYYAKNPNEPYCIATIDPKIKKVEDKMKNFTKR